MKTCKVCNKSYDEPECPVCKKNKTGEPKRVNPVDKTLLADDIPIINKPKSNISRQPVDTVLEVSVKPGRVQPAETDGLVVGENTPPVTSRGVQKTVPRVVGWLVVVDGPDVGRDFRIVEGHNQIGRGSQYAIDISGDGAITGLAADINFATRRGCFMLNDLVTHGEGVLVDDFEATKDHILETANEIKIGQTKMKFIAFCNNFHVWPQKDPAK